MRIEIGLLCLALLLTGCASPKRPINGLPTYNPPTSQTTSVTPDLRTVGRVELVNIEGRFVVLSFPPGRVPPAGQHWRITHRGLKIGEATISGPQREVDTVADLVEGAANVGDEATPE